MPAPLLKITDLEYAYPGTNKLILKKFSHELQQGEVVGVIGRNGVGKSTLMRLLAGIHQPLKGKIALNGISSVDIKNRKSYLSNFYYIAHDKTLMDDYKIKDFLELYSLLYENYSKKIEVSLMKKYDFDYNEKISKLSTGNKIKFYMLFALATNVELVLADEVTAVLDPENREDFFEIVSLFKNEKRTFIIATNIVEDLRESVDRVLYIEKGEVKTLSAADVLNVFKKKVA